MIKTKSRHRGEGLRGTCRLLVFLLSKLKYNPTQRERVLIRSIIVVRVEDDFYYLAMCDVRV